MVLELSPSHFSRWKEIGHGKNARVYSAYDQKQKRTVAIKKTTVSSYENKRLFDELYALEALQSAFVPGLYGYWMDIGHVLSDAEGSDEEESDAEGSDEEEDEIEDEEEYDVDPETYDTMYIVQEFIQGRTLQNIIRKELGYRLDCDIYVNEHREYREWVWEVIGQVLEAVSIFHSRGWKHNDLHDENIIWRPDKHMICILDFGLANQEIKKEEKIHSLLQSLTCLVSTPPGFEDVEGEEIYGLAVDFYESKGIELTPIVDALLLLLISSAYQRNVDLPELYAELNTQI